MKLMNSAMLDPNTSDTPCNTVVIAIYHHFCDTVTITTYYHFCFDVACEDLNSGLYAWLAGSLLTEPSSPQTSYIAFIKLKEHKDQINKT